MIFQYIVEVSANFQQFAEMFQKREIISEISSSGLKLAFWINLLLFLFPLE